MGGEVTIAGATGLLRCDRSCNVSSVRTTWYKNGSPLNLSQTRYGLASNGMLLYLEKVTPIDSGEYTCEMQVGETTYQRYCSLEVMESQSKSSPSCCRLVDLHYVEMLQCCTMFVSCSFGLWEKLCKKTTCSQRSFDLRWPISMAGYALFSIPGAILWRSSSLL